jgi:uncharacterized protein (TIGR00255 family)
LGRAAASLRFASEVGVLLSMTGYGEARFQSESLTLSIELRALNNRYLKVTVRAPDPYHLLEPEFEKVIRRTIKRGTLQVQLRCEKQSTPQDFRINRVALQSYVSQIQDAARELRLPDGGAALMSQALTLPGVVVEPGSLAFQLHEDWPVIEKVLVQALGSLQTMRQEEGKAMGQELLAHRDTIATHLERIRKRVTQVTTLFRDRLFERVRTLLTELDVKIDRSDLIKEVSIFAERSDIAEEIVRLASHLVQFQEIMGEPESPGRKLEFLTQEMFRETNTIGSKASDVEISREVVEIKGTLEKIRELVQNVE